ncbi:MAG: glutamine synthetase, partial [Patescibacteria group bacterium]
MKNLQQKILEEIERKNIQFIRFMWCDNAGVIRAKAVHVKYILDYLVGTGVGIAKAQQALPVMYDAPSKG